MCARRNSLATVILASTSSQFNCEHFDLKVLNQPAPPPFKESVRCAEQNLYVRSQELVGDRDPRQHEFSVQLRAFRSEGLKPAGTPTFQGKCPVRRAESLCALAGTRWRP